MTVLLLKRYQENYEFLSPLAKERVHTETFINAEFLRSVTISQQIFQVVQLRDLRIIARLDLDHNSVIM